MSFQNNTLHPAFEAMDNLLGHFIQEIDNHHAFLKTGIKPYVNLESVYNGIVRRNELFEVPGTFVSYKEFRQAPFVLSQESFTSFISGVWEKIKEFFRRLFGFSKSSSDSSISKRKGEIAKEVEVRMLKSDRIIQDKPEIRKYLDKPIEDVFSEELKVSDIIKKMGDTIKNAEREMDLREQLEKEKKIYDGLFTPLIEYIAQGRIGGTITKKVLAGVIGDLFSYEVLLKDLPAALIQDFNSISDLVKRISDSSIQEHGQVIEQLNGLTLASSQQIQQFPKVSRFKGIHGGLDHDYDPESVRMVEITTGNSLFFSLQNSDSGAETLSGGNNNRPYHVQINSDFTFADRTKDIKAHTGSLTYEDIKSLFDLLKDRCVATENNSTALSVEIRRVRDCFESLEKDIDVVMKKQESTKLSPVLSVVRSLLKILYAILEAEKRAKSDANRLLSALLHAEHGYMKLFDIFERTQDTLYQLS